MARSNEVIMRDVESAPIHVTYFIKSPTGEERTTQLQLIRKDS